MSGTGPQTVLVMGGGIRLPRALHRHGVRVIFAGTPGEFTADHQDVCAQAWLTDDPDEEFWVHRAVTQYRNSPFDFAVSLRERFLTAAARVNDALGLGGNSLATVLALKDKATMRGILADAPGAVGPTAQARVLATPGDLLAFVERAGWPVVVKPRDGTGSEEVRVLHGEEDLVMVLAQVESRPEGFLVEEFLSGPEYSVETLSLGGVHQVLAVTEKFVGESSVETGHLVPARLAPEQADALVAAARHCLDSVGLLDGPAHTEVILTPDGPCVVESHNRYGGDGINDLVRHSSGTDPRDLFAAQLASGEPVPVPVTVGSAAVWFVTAVPGEVIDMDGWEQAATATGVVGSVSAVAMGDTVRPLAGSDDRCGWVMAVGPSGDEALARARDASARIRIRTRVPTLVERS